MVLYFLLFLFARRCRADNRIILQLRHAPEAVQTQVIAEIQNNNPESTDEALTKKVTPGLSGFVAMYGGYWTRSNEDGSISFPLRHTKPELYLAITPKIELKRVKGDTISHNEYCVTNNNPTKLYHFEQKKDTHQADTTPTDTAPKTAEELVDGKGKPQDNYWSVQEVKPLPAGNIIDPLTVIILTDPDNLVIDSTDQKAAPNPQLVIPDIFVVGNKGTAQAQFEAMDLNNHFEHLETTKKPSAPESTNPTLSSLVVNP